MRDAESVAKSLGVVVQGVDAEAAEFDAAFSAMKRARARRRHPREHAPSSPTSASRELGRLAPAADDAAAPVSEAGALLSYAPDYPNRFVVPPTLLDKNPQRAKPGDLPIEQPTKFEW